MKEERALSFSGKVNDQALQMSIVDCDKLLFSIFSLLQNLGADERPEVFVFSVQLNFFLVTFFEHIADRQLIFRLSSPFLFSPFMTSSNSGICYFNPERLVVAKQTYLEYLIGESNLLETREPIQIIEDM